MTDDKPAQTRTDWLTVWIATFGGAAAAMQIGKAGATLPALRAEFGMTVGTLALYVSLISLVAATLGLAFGLITRRFGLRRSASTGLILLVVASLLPVLFPSVQTFLASRSIEALGFALCTTSFPGMVRAAASPRRQSLAMGIWAAWMPAGIVLALAAAAVIPETSGWRTLFVICAIVPFVSLVALRFVARGLGARLADTGGQRVRDTLLRAAVMRTAVIFMLFAASNMIYVGFLPTILVDERAMNLNTANRLVLLSMFCLIPFNLWTGWVLDKGVSAVRLYAVSFLVMALAPFVFLWTGASSPALWVAAVFFGAAAGVVPSVVWAQVPRLTRSADEAPLVSGSIYQGAGIGQISGPLIVGWWVEFSGDWWPFAVAIAILSIGGIAVAMQGSAGNRQESAPSQAK